MTCDGGCRCIDRRSFLEAVTAILGSAGLAACASSLPAITTFTVNISSYPSLANVGGLAMVQGGSQPVAVTRIDANTFVALSLVCPHRGITVQIAGAAFYCPGHGAAFAADGTWTGGQRTSSLSRYPLTYDAAAGNLTIG